MASYLAPYMCHLRPRSTLCLDNFVPMRQTSIAVIRPHHRQPRRRERSLMVHSIIDTDEATKRQ
jgi:hypothetical protein